MGEAQKSGMRPGAMVMAWAGAYLLDMDIQFGPWLPRALMADRWFVYRIVLYWCRCGCIFSLN